MSREFWNAQARDLAHRFPGRDEQIHALQVAVLSGEHAFLLGPPGTGKTSLVRAFAAGLDGRLFEQTLSRTRSDAAVLGPLDIPLLRDHGRFQRARAGYLLDCEWAFLDEIGHISPELGHDLLAALSDRVRHEVSEGRSVHAIPLRSAFTAGNSVPGDDGADDARALWDRLLVRVPVDYLPREQARALLTAPEVSADRGASFLDGAAPGGAFHDGAAPGGASRDGAALGGACLDGAVRGGALCDGAVPGAASRDGAAPGGASRDGAAPGGASRDGAAPGGASRDGAAPGGASRDGTARLALAALDRHRAAVDAVTVPDDVVEAVLDLRDTLDAAGDVFSDRRWRAVMRLLRAHAWLDGRSSVRRGDLAVLRFALWNTREQRTGVLREIAVAADPTVAERLALVERARLLAGVCRARRNDPVPDRRTWTREARRKLRALTAAAGQLALRGTAAQPDAGHPAAALLLDGDIDVATALADAARAVDALAPPGEVAESGTRRHTASAAPRARATVARS